MGPALLSPAGPHPADLARAVADVMLAERHVEAFLSADESTTEVLRRRCP
jgi:hypothetical protein